MVASGTSAPDAMSAVSSAPAGEPPPSPCEPSSRTWAGDDAGRRTAGRVPEGRPGLRVHAVCRRQSFEDAKAQLARVRRANARPRATPRIRCRCRVGTQPLMPPGRHRRRRTLCRTPVGWQTLQGRQQYAQRLTCPMRMQSPPLPDRPAALPRVCGRGAQMRCRITLRTWSRRRGVCRICGSEWGPPQGLADPDGIMRFTACPRPENRYVSASSGRGAAWLARPSGGRKVASSNLAGPTNTKPPAPARDAGGSV